MASAPTGFTGTDRFELRGALGKGATSVVYEAYDRERQQTVALKTLKRFDAESVLRFKNEFRALHDIDHPNLVSLYELFERNGEWFFTMELIAGTDFMSYVRAGRQPAPGVDEGSSSLSAAGTFDEARLRSALAQLARGIATLHAANQIHRDVKPSNIRIAETGRLVLLDFGLVTPASQEEERTSEVFVGTAAYAAPEQALGGEVGPSADCYSVGVLLYEALTARLPHTGRTLLQLVLNKQQRPADPPHRWVDDVPSDLDELCGRLLSPEPTERPTARDLQHHFDEELDDAEVPAAPSGLPGSPRTSTFVGRRDELTQLRASFADSQSRPVVVLVEGASGLGKSELVQHFAEKLQHEAPETLVLKGRCYERDSVPYKAFDGLVDELSRYIVRLPETTARELLPLRADLLPRQFPVLLRVEAFANALPGREPSDAQELRRQVFGALRQLFTHLTKRQRVVLVIDDLQWTDRDSLTLLQELLGGADAPRLLLVGTLRPTAPETRERLLTSVRGLSLHTIKLGPLRAEDAEQLAENLLPAHDARAIAAIAKEGGGYPLFIMELARHFDGTAGEVRSGDVDLDEALWERISQLPGDLLPVLQIVCTASARLTLGMTAHAAELSLEQLFRVATSLRSGSLVRTTGARADAFIEPYHDRIRETVDRHLVPTRRRQCHRGLGEALRRADTTISSSHALVGHTLAAGDAAGAARYAEAAARRAVTATAFGRAADFFAMALELGRHGKGKEQTLQLELAWALLHAGRGSESANAFDAAAKGADAATRRDCQRLAAEQLLISGHIGPGLERLDEALAEFGESPLGTPRRALFAVLWRRFKLRIRGLGWREREADDITPADRARLQVVGAAALGLSMVDSIRGAAFNARFVQLALQSGDAAEVARALGTEAMMSAYQGKYARAKMIIAALSEVEASHPEDPHIAGWAAIARGGHSYFRGDFPAGEEIMRKAGSLLSQVSGATWERNNSNMFVMFCLRYQGKLRELDALVGAERRDAERRGDLYMEISVRRYGARYAMLAGDRPGEALADLEQTAWPAPKNVFHLQDWQKLEARCEIALYAGEVGHMRKLAEREFAALDRSMLLRITTVRSPSTYLRARLLLAHAPRPDDLRRVEKLARQLQRESEGYPTAWAHLLSAAVAHQRDQPAHAVGKLRDAIEVSEQYSMGYHRAVAQHRLSKLMGGAEGEKLRAESDRWMAEQAVRDPARMCEVLAPGW